MVMPVALVKAAEDNVRPPAGSLRIYALAPTERLGRELTYSILESSIQQVEWERAWRGNGHRVRNVGAAMHGCAGWRGLTVKDLQMQSQRGANRREQRDRSER